MIKSGVAVVLVTALVLLGAAGANAAPFSYITNQGNNTVSVIDTATNAVVTTLGVGCGVALQAKISPLSGGSCVFQIEGAGAPNLPTGNPVTLGLTIGDNTGSTTVTAQIQ